MRNRPTFAKSPRPSSLQSVGGVARSDTRAFRHARATSRAGPPLSVWGLRGHPLSRFFAPSEKPGLRHCHHHGIDNIRQILLVVDVALEKPLDSFEREPRVLVDEPGP